jgi:hypothetical protein
VAEIGINRRPCAMALEIETSIADVLPSMVKESLSRLPIEKQSMFVEEFKRKAKSPGLMLALAILFPIQLFLLGKTALGVAFWLTGGGCGLWWLIEVFLAFKRTREFNGDIAKAIVRDIKIMGD